MITSSGSLAADDLSIRCRVRRSQYAQNPDFGEAQEMTCTMRHWEETGGGGEAHTPPNDDCSGSLSSAELRRTPGMGRSQGSFGPGAAVSAFLGGSGNNVGDCTRGRELLLCPVHLPPRSSTSSFNLIKSSNQSDEGGGGGGGGALSQRFHSFGSTPALHDHSAHQHHRGVDADSDPGVRSTIPGRSPTRLRRDRVMSDGNIKTLPLDGRPPHKRHDSVHSSNSSNRSRSAGKRTPSLPRIRPSAAAAFAVGGLTGSVEKLDGSSRHDLTALQSYHISLSDVIVVDVDGMSPCQEEDFCAREGCRMNMTTVTNGYFEFVFQSKNSHDVLLAFLQASLPPERITNGASARNLAREGETDLSDSDKAISINASACCDTNQDSYDMENFTAREMKRTIKREGLGDKIRRRFHHISGQLQDVSLSLTECFCGGSEADLAEEPPVRRMSAPATPTPQTPNFRGKRAAAEVQSMYTPVKEGCIDSKFSMENTPLRPQEMTHPTAEDRTPAKKHMPGFSFDASTPGQLPQVAASPDDKPGNGKEPPLIPDIITSSPGGNGGEESITPVGTSTSESEDGSRHGEKEEEGSENNGNGKHEEYCHDDTDQGMKLQTVDI